MKTICEFWCSPCRHEIYSEVYIVAESTEDQYITDEIKEYTGQFGMFWCDVFDDAALHKGLYKIVCEIDTNWEHTVDWEGIPDTEVHFVTNVLFKSKCYSFGELKWKWLELTGKTQQYYDKVLCKSFSSEFIQEY